MKHPIRWILIGMLTLPVLLVVIANGTAVSPDELPPPDRSLLITLPDGRSEPLSELLARSSLPEVEDQQEPAPQADASPSALAHDARDQQAADVTGPVAEVSPAARWPSRVPADDDLYGLAESALRRGDHEQALALYRSLPDDHPCYGCAQRRIGWDLYTEALGDPGRGIAFVNRSLREDPTEGNAWQDAYRVYAASVGVTLD